MGIRRWSMVVTVALAGCGDDADQNADDAWEPSSDEAPDDDGGEAPADDDDTGGDDETAGVDDPTMPGESDDGVDDSTTGSGFDCSPWQTVWIGAPCASDAECAYDGGVCLREDQGFPCGTCSQ